MATSTAGAGRPISQHSGSPADASTESGRSPISSHTPFLQNLSQRFRRGSNVSSNTSDSQGQHADKNEGGTVPVQNPKQQERARAEAARAAKRYLMTIVRNDWEFSPDTPLPQQQNSHPDSREPVSWRLRNDGSEDELDHAHPNSPTKRRSKSDPYRFENPDAVAGYVLERQIKRRKVLHEQMVWNEGLRNWALERDAWTGAVWKNAAGTSEQKDLPNGPERDDGLGIILRKGDIPDSGTSTTRTTSSNTPSEPDHNAHALPNTAESPTPEASGHAIGTSIDSLEHTTTATATTSADPTAAAATAISPSTNKANVDPPRAQWQPPSPNAQGPYIPIYPPLFPEDNVLRSRIQPATYGTIYSKVVVQSLTPNIPIPLPDMVRSLVHGWKEEGQWPPSGNPGDGIVALKSARNGGAGAGGKRDGGAFARWRREKERKAKDGAGASGTAGRKGSVGALIGEGSGAGDESGHVRPGHRVRRSISSVVKRVIGLEDEEARRTSEVGLSLGFEEDDEIGDGFGGEGGDGTGRQDRDADERLNSALLAGGAG